jgi:hypothetical protein
MQRKIDRLVIGRENNVVRVNFSRDPDPPAPRFPGATGLREIGDESGGAAKNISAVALSAPLSNFSNIAAKHGLGVQRGAVNASPDGRRSESRVGRSSVAT